MAGPCLSSDPGHNVIKTSFKENTKTYIKMKLESCDGMKLVGCCKECADQLRIYKETAKGIKRDKRDLEQKLRRKQQKQQEQNPQKMSSMKQTRQQKKNKQ